MTKTTPNLSEGRALFAPELPRPQPAGLRCHLPRRWLCGGGVAPAHVCPGDGEGRADVFQPATGRAGKFTQAQHVHPSILRATPALRAGGCSAARRGAADGAAGPGASASLGGGFCCWEECIYGFCHNRGASQAGNWGAGADATTPRVYVTTCSPGSAGSASALRGSV